MVTRKEAIKKLHIINRKNETISYKIPRTNKYYSAGKIIDFVYDYEGKDDEYKHVIEKVKKDEREEGKGNCFRIGYYTLFQRRKNVKNSELKNAWYANWGSQQGARPDEDTFYDMLIQGFKNKEFFSKRFRKRVYTLLKREFEANR